MIARKFGRIINISSQAGIIALRGHVAYMASKAAINGITQVLALEWRPLGITTNAVAPTVVNTELGKAVWSDPAKGDPMCAMIPVGRFAEPGEVAAAVLYLASDAAAMVNGHVLRIDGGATIHLRPARARPAHLGGSRPDRRRIPQEGARRRSSAQNPPGEGYVVSLVAYRWQRSE